MKFGNYVAEQFDDIRILRYQVPAFEHLTLKEKILVYYLSRAASAGRDILWDQNNEYNIELRRILERILLDYTGNRECDEFRHFVVYAKKVFFANGLHHHYSMDKFVPRFLAAYFRNLTEAVGQPEAFARLERIMFDPGFMAKRVVLDGDKDVVEASANNYYQGVTQKEAERFYAAKQRDVERPVSVGLNSTLVKREGKVEEDVWKMGGKYGDCIENIVFWLEKAKEYACNERQADIIGILIEYYRTGNLALFDDFSIAWLKEKEGKVDFINGFIEVYGDPLGLKGSWEAVVQIVDDEACKRTSRLAENALWFEENAPVEARFKRMEVSGITARVMQVAQLGGDCYPATPIGINLPNSEWIRERYGSKSVTFDNITYAYHMASLNSGVTDEFAYSDEEKERSREYGYLAGNIHTDLHECLGHGSGKMLSGVTTEVLKNYYSTLEEARADLFALYYILDPKLEELGIIPSIQVGMCEYDTYIRNGLLVQLTRIKPGDKLEEAHMRNRQLIAQWAYNQGLSDRVIEKVSENGKTYFVIRDYQALRALFGKLLAEIQRIKSEGDYEAARQLIERYGVDVDGELHCEVLKRYERLNVPPYAGFINPEYRLVEKEGRITDVEVVYPEDYLTQMLHL